MARRCFTLLEVLIAMTIVAAATAVVTLNYAGMTDAARLRAAADQIGGLHRLTVARASAGGLPQVLVLHVDAISVRRPMERDGEWSWAQGPLMDLPAGVILRRVFPAGATADASPGSDGAWTVPIRPSGNVGYRIGLQTASGMEADVNIDGFTGVASLRLLEGEQR